MLDRVLSRSFLANSRRQPSSCRVGLTRRAEAIVEASDGNGRRRATEQGSVALTGVLCGSALACRCGDALGTRAIAVSVFAGCGRSLAGWPPAAATAGCFG